MGYKLLMTYLSFCEVLSYFDTVDEVVKSYANQCTCNLKEHGIDCINIPKNPMNTYTSLTDAELVSLLQKDNEHAFEEIYKRYAESLNRFAYSRLGIREESDEMVQEVFVTLWQKRKSMASITQLNAYLFRAVQNRIISYFRSAKVREVYAESFTLFTITHEDSLTHEVEHAELQAILNQGLQELPERCQTAFRLSRIHNMTIQEIAVHMEISARTVENYITQALKHLRAYWQKNYHQG